jgi:hypothetical protein
VDLLEHLTEADLLQAVLANVHRYKPEPNFSKTGVGSLLPTSAEERAKEIEHSTELIRKIEARLALNGKNGAKKSRPVS